MRKVVLPPDPRAQAAIAHSVSDWWTSLRNSENPGAATWEVLDRIEQEVTDCLVGGDVAKASSLTAEAMLLVTGSSDL